MKKTLVSLALASLAASAFANTSFYSAKDETSSANLYVNGYARVNYGLGKYDAQSKETEAFQSYDKYDSQNVHTKFRFELGGDFSASDLTFGFLARAQYERDNLAHKVLVEEPYYSYNNNTVIYTPAVQVKEPKYGDSVLTVSGLNLTKYYGYVAHANYGKLVFGKTDTLVDNAFSDDLEVLETFGTAVTAKTSAPFSVNYTYNYSPVSLSLGYAKDHKTDGKQFRQYAVQLAAEDVAGSRLQLVYANETGRHDAKLTVGVYVNNQTTAKEYGVSAESAQKQYVTNSVDFTVSNSKLVNDFTFALGLAYEVKQNYDDHLASETVKVESDDKALEAVDAIKVTPLKTTKETRFSASVKAAYTGTQYFTPYVGYSYVDEKVKNGTENVSATKKHYAYLGASSTVWSKDSVALSLFAEAGLQQFKAKQYFTNVQNGKSTKETLDSKAKAVAYAVGAKFSF